VPSSLVLHTLISSDQLNRTSSSKKETKEPKSGSSSAPPPPPPNNQKPLPPPGNALNGSAASSQSNQPATPDRRHVPEANGTPPPPIVVVSPDAAPDAPYRNNTQPTTPDRPSGGGLDLPGGPPRASISNMSRLRANAKDTIPIVGKPPRKQRSSRFVITEKVEIERLPPFMGRFSLFHLHVRSLTLC
jgi:serine/threonine-protein phosphatase 2A regulatory subunit B'